MAEGGKDIGPQQEQPRVPEVKVPEPRAYEEIKEDLEALSKDPNFDPKSEELRLLRVERARLLQKAKPIFISLKGTMAEVQRDNGKDNFLGVETAIASIDTNRLEQEASGISGWDTRFEGLIEEYRDGAIRNMSLAWLRTLERNGQPVNQDVVSDAEKRIACLNWGSPPAGLEMMAESFLQYMLQAGMQTQQQGRSLSTKNIDPNLYERGMRQPLPSHVGALFEGGKNSHIYYAGVAGEHLTPLDIKKEDDGWKFILRNLEAYNNVFGDYKSWIPVVFIWREDAVYAARATNIENTKQYSEFEDRLYACNAITVSARLMEKANADLGGFLDFICGGEASNSFQIQMKRYILQGDDKKIATALKNPLVSQYFHILLRDAGIKAHEKVNNYGQIIDAFSFSPTEAMRNSPLVSFLRKKETGGLNVDWKGGFDGYLENLVSREGPKGENDEQKTEFKDKYPEKVSDEDPERFEKRAAAKLACDIFFTTLYTRYDDRITERGTKYNDFALSPCGNWAGDPFTEVIYPPHLYKNVKSGYPRYPDVWKIIDAAFRPRDVNLAMAKVARDQSFGVPNKKQMEAIGREEYGISTKLLRPDATTSIAHLNRYHQALSAVMGDPMVGALSDISGEGIKGIAKAATLMAQIYPLLGFSKDPDRNKEIARQLDAAFFARVVLAKIVAFHHEFRMGTITSIKNILEPDKSSAPIKGLSEFMVAMWGPNARTRQEGLINIFEERYGFNFGGNMGLNAEGTLAEARRLATSLGADPRLAAPLVVGKALLDIGKVLAETAGMK